MNQLPILCNELNELQVIDAKFKYPEAIDILIKTNLDNTSILWELADKKVPSRSTHPSAFLLCKINNKSPLFHRFFAILCIWDHLLNVQFNKEFKKRIIKGTQIEERFSDLSKDLSKEIENSGLNLKDDFILIALRLRNWCSVNNNVKYREEYATLRDFIDALLIKRNNYSFKTERGSDAEKFYLNKGEPQFIEVSGETSKLEKIFGIKGLIRTKDKTIHLPHILEIAPPEIASKSEPFKTSYAKASQWRRSLEAQFLDNANECLTPAEESLFIDSAIKDNSLASTQVLISILLGAEPHLWSDFWLSRVEGTTWIDLENNIWGQPVYIGQNFNIPNENVKYLFEESEDIVILPLPEVLVKRLKPLASGKKTLGELFETSPEKSLQDCNSWIHKINSLGRNISLAKLRDFLYYKIMHNTFDEAAAFHIPAQIMHKEHRSITYTNFSQPQLQKIYTDCFPQITFASASTSECFNIGSHVTFKQDELKNLLSELQKTAQESIKNITQSRYSLVIEEFFNTHNNIVCYLALEGLLQTSHRPVNDMFARPFDFITDMNCVFISDKIVDPMHMTRFSFFSDTYKDSINSYEEYLKLISRIAKETFPQFSEFIEKIYTESNKTNPYFFFIAFQNNQVSVNRLSQTSLYKYLIKINPIWENIPLNFGRHYLSSALRKLDLNPEYINYQLGHMSNGEEPSGSNSILSVRILSKIIVPELNKITSQLNSKPLTINLKLLGLTKLFKQLSNSELQFTHDSEALGPIRRIQEYKDQNRYEKSLVRTIFQNLFQNLPENTSQELFDICLEEAVRKIINNSSIRLHDNLRRLTRFLKAKSKQLGLKFNPPIALLKVDIEPSAFHYLEIQRWHQLNAWHNKWYSTLIKTDWGKLSINEGFAYLLITFKLNTKFSDQNRLKLFLEKLIKKQFFYDEGRVMVDIPSSPKNIQRIPLDGLSSGILAKLLNKDWSKLKINIVMRMFNDTLNSTLGTKLKEMNIVLRIDAYLTMPNFLAGAQSGEQHYASMPLESYARITTQNRLDFNPQEKSSEEISDKQSLSLLPIRSNQREFDLKEQKKTITSFIWHFNLHKKRSEILSAIRKQYFSEVSGNTKLADVTKYLCIWLIFRLELKGKKVEELKPSTIRGYFSAIHSLLIEHLIDKDLSTISEMDLIQIYNVIIASKSKEQQSVVAEQLLFFHNKTLVTLIRQIPIDSEDLEFESGKNENIHAAIILPGETQNATSLILHAAIPEFLKLQFSCLTSLYSKYGFRPSELTDIQPKDVIVQNDFKESFTIKHNPLGGLKNSQSYRNVLEDNKLSVNESIILHSCIKLHSSSTTSTKSFWIPDLTESSHDSPYFKDAIKNVIKYSTGDDFLTLKSLRHSACTLDMLAYLANALDFEGIEHAITDSFKLNVHFPNGLDNFLNKALSNQLPSRRQTYRTGRMIGHITSRTSLTNYMHGYEFVLPYFYENEFASNTSALIETLFEASKDTVKGQKKRRKDRVNLFDYFSLQKLKKLAPNNNFNFFSKVKFADIDYPLEFQNLKKTKLTPLLYTHAISYLKSNPECTPGIIENRYLISSSTLKALELSYFNLAIETGLDPFNLSITINQINIFNFKDRAPEQNHNVKFLTSKQEPKISILDKEIPEKLISLWRKYVNTSHKLWHFERDQQMVDYINGLIKIGIPKEQIWISNKDELLDGQVHQYLGIKYKLAKKLYAKPNSREINTKFLEFKPGIAVTDTSGRFYLNELINDLLFMYVSFKEAEFD